MVEERERERERERKGETISLWNLESYLKIVFLGYSSCKLNMCDTSWCKKNLICKKILLYIKSKLINKIIEKSCGLKLFYWLYIYIYRKSQTEHPKSGHLRYSLGIHSRFLYLRLFSTILIWKCTN